MLAWGLPPAWALQEAGDPAALAHSRSPVLLALSCMVGAGRACLRVPAPVPRWRGSLGCSLAGDTGLESQTLCPP